MSKSIILDTETTGFDSENDEILQLSIIDNKGEVIFNEYFKPERKVEWISAMAVNGITPEFVSDKKNIKEYKTEIQKIFDNAKCIIGYNTQFDLGFLEAVGIKLNEQTETVDVMRDFAEVYGEINESTGKYKWQKLTKCAEYYNFDWTSTGTHAHDSLGDCFATLYCYQQMEYKAQQKVISDLKHKISSGIESLYKENTLLTTMLKEYEEKNSKLYRENALLTERNNMLNREIEKLKDKQEISY